MSIKVMTWVWDHSPAAGTDLLMMLAIADQADDSGLNAWPSVRTLAQRTRLDERTVRRVLKRLASDGHIRIHPGGGRRSNRYQIPMTSANTDLSTPRADCHPGHNATRDTATGVPGQDASAGLTQLGQGTPDTAVPSDPSSTRPRPTSGPRLRVVGDEGGGVDSGGVEVLASLGPEWTLTPKQRRRLSPLVAKALSAGWSPQALTAHIGANPDGVKSPAAVLAARLDDLPCLPEPPEQRPAWCGGCDETTRHRERPDGRVERCPDCHPRTAGWSAAGDDPARRRSRQAPTPRRVSSQ